MRTLVTVLGALGAMVLRPATAEEHGWPIEPIDKDHPLVNTFGEFVRSTDGPYHHEGIDISVTPYSLSENAPFAVVAVSGIAIRWTMNDVGKGNTIDIMGDDGKIYRYAHLQSSELSLALDQYLKDSSCPSRSDEECNLRLEAGTPIARITDKFPCGLYHLHFDVVGKSEDLGTIAINPLLEIQPRPDNSPPKIRGLHLARAGSNPWVEFVSGQGGGTCTSVDGDVDIIVEVSDSDAANSTLESVKNVGIYDLEWKVCPANASECEWQPTYKYDLMPAEWTYSTKPFAQKHFSITSAFVTTTEPWAAEAGTCPPIPEIRTFVVLAVRSVSGSWETKNESTPNDTYMLSVRASDAAGNQHERSREVCVAND